MPGEPRARARSADPLRTVAYSDAGTINFSGNLKRLEERAFPSDVDRSSAAESVKADLREAFGSGAIDPQRWVERFSRGDPKERSVMSGNPTDDR